MSLVSMVTLLHLLSYRLSCASPIVVACNSRKCGGFPG
jgi:hypothetical protein